MALVSAHKLGGPKGVGALVVKRGTDLAAQIRGGGQEMGRRAGTENVIGIAGFGAAAEAAARDLAEGVWERSEKLRNILESAIEAEAGETIFVGKGAIALAQHVLYRHPRLEGRDAGDADGPCGVCHLGGFGLFQRQGAHVPRVCARWDMTTKRPVPRSAYRWGRRRRKRRSGVSSTPGPRAPANSGRARRKGERPWQHSIRPASDPVKDGVDQDTVDAVREWAASTSTAGTPRSRWTMRPRA